jgi:hypothetical protein
MLKKKNVRFDHTRVGTSNGFLLLFFAVRKSDYELETVARQLRITGSQADVQKVNKIGEGQLIFTTGNNKTK